MSDRKLAFPIGDTCVIRSSLGCEGGHLRKAWGLPSFRRQIIAYLPLGDPR